MKISEMNKCIAAMRDCYNFKDDDTDISLVNLVNYDERCVYISTKDENGTQIEMTRRANELKQ